MVCFWCASLHNSPNGLRSKRQTQAPCLRVHELFFATVLRHCSPPLFFDFCFCVCVYVQSPRSRFKQPTTTNCAFCHKYEHQCLKCHLVNVLSNTWIVTHATSPFFISSTFSLALHTRTSHAPHTHLIHINSLSPSLLSLSHAHTFTLSLPSLTHPLFPSLPLSVSSPLPSLSHTAPDISADGPGHRQRHYHNA